MNKLMVLEVLLCMAGIMFGQGTLTPPGAPTPTMKTLEQIEPRMPIPDGNGMPVINESGSYYLTTNLHSSLVITADNVSLDLSGYTISTGNQRGIDVASGVNNLILRNGMISGNDVGVYALNIERGMNVFRDLIVTGNGVGIHAGPGCLIESCHVESNSTYGVRIEWGSGNIVRRCRISRNDEYGIAVLSGTCLVENNLIEGNGIAGLSLLSDGSAVRGNTVKGNVKNYDFVHGNRLELLLSEVPEALEWPCSAKFTGALICHQPGTNGITITSSDVALDLAGHSLYRSGEPGLSSGVYITPGANRVSVRNGQIQGWVDSSGAGITGSGIDTQIENIFSHRNYIGFKLGGGSRIEACSAIENLDMGFVIGEDSLIQRSLASCNGVNGINIGDRTRIKDCLSVKNGHDGIMTGSSCLIDGCNSVSNMFDGIFSADNCQIRNCVVDSNGEDGVEVNGQCTVTQCTVGNNGRTGINTIASMNTVDGNTVTLNGLSPAYPTGRAGVMVTASGNLIIRNRLSSNTPGADFNIVQGNQIGTVMPPPAPTSPGVVGNAGGGFGVTDPFANIVY